MMLFVRRSAAAATAIATRPVAVVLGRRAMAVAKGTSRAAVHGSRPPTNTTVEGREEAEERIEKGKEEKQKMRKQVEDKVDAALGSGGGHSDDHTPTK